MGQGPILLPNNESIRNSINPGLYFQQPLSYMKRAELIEEFKSRGLKGYSGKTVPQLISLINQDDAKNLHENIPDVYFTGGTLEEEISNDLKRIIREQPGFEPTGNFTDDILTLADIAEGKGDPEFTKNRDMNLNISNVIGRYTLEQDDLDINPNEDSD